MREETDGAESSVLSLDAILGESRIGCVNKVRSLWGRSFEGS